MVKGDEATLILLDEELQAGGRLNLQCVIKVSDPLHHNFLHSVRKIGIISSDHSCSRCSTVQVSKPYGKVCML